MRSSNGVTLIEVVLVFIVVVISTTLATGFVQRGIENRQVKQVAATLQTLAHAVRSYQLENDALPTQTDLSEVFDGGFADENVLAYDNEFDYTFVPNNATPSQWSIRAIGPRERTIIVRNTASGFVTSDSEGFLHA